MMAANKLTLIALILIFLAYPIFGDVEIAFSNQGLSAYTNLQIDSKDEVTCMDSIIKSDQIKTSSLGMISDPKTMNAELMAKGSSIAGMIGSVKNLAVTIHEMKKFKELYEQEAFNDILQDLVDQGSLPAAELSKKKEQLSAIYNKIKTYNALMDSIKVKYDLYEDKNKQLHANVSSDFGNFTITSHHYFQDNNLEGEIVFKGKNTHAVIRNFSLTEVNNLDIPTNYNHILELLRNDGFEVTSNMISAGVSDAKIVVRNVSEGEAKTEKKSEVATDQNVESQKAAVDKSENLKSSPTDNQKKKGRAVAADKKQKKKTVAQKTTQKVKMTYAKTKEFVLSNLPLLKRIFKEHITPAAIGLLKNDAVMSFAIRKSYNFIPAPVQMTLSQETYVACCMTSKNVIINYVT